MDTDTDAGIDDALALVLLAPGAPDPTHGDPIAALVAIAPASIAATFVTGKATVEGPTGAERCVLAPSSPGARVTRSPARCDSNLVAEARSSAPCQTDDATLVTERKRTPATSTSDPSGSDNEAA